MAPKPEERNIIDDTGCDTGTPKPYKPGPLEHPPRIVTGHLRERWPMASKRRNFGKVRVR